jgi:hypothetical protein
MHKSAALAIVAAALFGGSAHAQFNNDQCRDFLTGSWSTAPEAGGVTGMRITYSPGGTYSQGDEAALAQEGAEVVAAGGWDALAGKGAAECELILTPKGEKAQSLTVTVIDDQTIKTSDGQTAKRVAQPDPAAPAASQ